MVILPIKRSEFEEGMPKKSYLFVKFLISLAISIIISFFLMKIIYLITLNEIF